MRASDQLYVFAYPSFNVNEILAIADLYEGSARESGKPMVVFNGALPCKACHQKRRRHLPHVTFFFQHSSGITITFHFCRCTPTTVPSMSAGELDRIRSGYYPPLFYPKLGQLAKTFIPQFQQAYYGEDLCAVVLISCFQHTSRICLIHEVFFAAMGSDMYLSALILLHQIMRNSNCSLKSLTSRYFSTVVHNFKGSRGGAISSFCALLVQSMYCTDELQPGVSHATATLTCRICHAPQPRPAVRQQPARASPRAEDLPRTKCRVMVALL